MVGMVDGGRTSQSGIRERSEHGKQMRPGRIRRGRKRGTTIPHKVGVGVPIAHQKVIGRENRGLRGETSKEGAALRALRRSIDVCKFKNLPMEAKSRKKNASFMKDVERRASKGGGKKNGRVFVLGSRRTPDMCPKVTVIGSVDRKSVV